MFEPLSSCYAEPSSRQEISAEIRRIKSNKSQPEDNILPELFKATAEELAPVLPSLFSRIWSLLNGMYLSSFQYSRKVIERCAATTEESVDLRYLTKFLKYPSSLVSITY
jgi:hypothetical protein